MAKKRILLIAVSVVFILVFIILNMFVFALNNVKLSFISTPINISEDDYDDIIRSANFKMGRSVLFYSKDKHIVNFEAYNPYLKVTNIETVFPSTFIVHATERYEIFNLKTSNNTFIAIDEELKVLSSGLDVPNVIEVRNLNFLIQNSMATPGKFLNLNNSETAIMQRLVYSLTVCKLDAMQITQFLSSMEFHHQQQNAVLLQTNAGVEIIIERADRNFLNKIIHAVSVFNAITDVQQSSGTILIQESTANFEIILQSYIV